LLSPSAAHHLNHITACENESIARRNPGPVCPQLDLRRKGRFHQVSTRQKSAEPKNTTRKSIVASFNRYLHE